MPAILEINHLNFSYNSQPVLKDISFVIHGGQYIGIVGPNGGGKTTLIKLILGFLKPDSGQIKLLGQEINHFNQWSKIGYVPQKLSSASGDFPATVSEIILNNWNAGPGKNKTEALDKALQITDIQNLKHNQLSDLSGGQRQRVFIARSLLNDPELLILDEPTTGIDQQSQDKFYDFLRTLHDQMKLTIIFISHDLERVSEQADQLLCVNQTLFIDNRPQHLPHLHQH